MGVGVLLRVQAGPDAKKKYIFQGLDLLFQEQHAFLKPKEIYDQRFSFKFHAVEDLYS